MLIVVVFGVDCLLCCGFIVCLLIFRWWLICWFVVLVFVLVVVVTLLVDFFGLFKNLFVLAFD